MESCVSVRRKEAKSGRIIWKGYIKKWLGSYCGRRSSSLCKQRGDATGIK